MSGLVRMSVSLWVPVFVRMHVSRSVSVALCVGRPGAAATVVMPAEVAQESGQVGPVVVAQTAEDLLGRGPAGLFQALQESEAAVGQSDQNRAAIVGVGGPDDQPGGFDSVDHRGHRSGHDLEAGGDISHPQRPSRRGHQPEDPGLSHGQTEGRQLGG